jgi:hypothetical protein
MWWSWHQDGGEISPHFKFYVFFLRLMVEDGAGVEASWRCPGFKGQREYILQDTLLEIFSEIIFLPAFILGYLRGVDYVLNSKEINTLYL